MPQSTARTKRIAAGLGAVGPLRSDRGLRRALAADLPTLPTSAEVRAALAVSSDC